MDIERGRGTYGLPATHHSVIVFTAAIIAVFAAAVIAAPWRCRLVIVMVTGNPGVSQGYLYPYLRKPVPARTGKGSGRSG